MLQGNGKLTIVARDGHVEWQMPWEGIHDVHASAGGTLMVQQGPSKIVEIDVARRKIVWEYDSERRTGTGDGGSRSTRFSRWLTDA